MKKITTFLVAGALSLAAIGTGVGIAVAAGAGAGAPAVVRTQRRVTPAAPAPVAAQPAETESVEDDAADEPITGDPLARASAAALAHTGEGRVTETEVGDEESYYEVEVTLDDGSQVDVQLDEQFNVVGQEADEESGEDD